MTGVTETPTVTTSTVPEGVTRPIPAALLSLTVPALGSYLLRIAYQWVDALWVRGLGVEATAAVTTSMFVLWTVYSINDIFAIGVTAYASQLLGAGDRARAGLAAYKGLRASLLLGLGISVCGILFARRIYALMAPDPAMAEAGAAYLGVVLAGAPLPMVALTCEYVMRASGDTRTPMLLDLAAVAINAALAPFLIYGIGPFPAMGVAGSAWATVIAQAALVAGYLRLAARGHRAFPFATRAPGPPIRLRGMLKVGLPTAAIGILFSVVYMAFTRSASRSARPRWRSSASPTASRRSSSRSRPRSAWRPRAWSGRTSGPAAPTAPSNRSASQSAGRCGSRRR